MKHRRSGSQECKRLIEPWDRFLIRANKYFKSISLNLFLRDDEVAHQIRSLIRRTKIFTRRFRARESLRMSEQSLGIDSRSCHFERTFARNNSRSEWPNERLGNIIIMSVIVNHFEGKYFDPSGSRELVWLLGFFRSGRPTDQRVRGFSTSEGDFVSNGRGQIAS